MNDDAKTNNQYIRMPELVLQNFIQYFFNIYLTKYPLNPFS